VHVRQVRYSSRKSPAPSARGKQPLILVLSHCPDFAHTQISRSASLLSERARWAVRKEKAMASVFAAFAGASARLWPFRVRRPRRFRPWTWLERRVELHLKNPPPWVKDVIRNAEELNHHADPNCAIIAVRCLPRLLASKGGKRFSCRWPTALSSITSSAWASLRR